MNRNMTSNRHCARTASLQPTFIIQLFQRLLDERMRVYLVPSHSKLEVRKMHNGVSLSGGFLPLGPSELLVDLCIARWKSYKRGKRCLELTASGHHLLQRHGAQKLVDALLASRDMQQLLRE